MSRLVIIIFFSSLPVLIHLATAPLKAGGFSHSYICDFAVTADRIYVIELNPFLTSTDACLYSWTHDAPMLRGETIPLSVDSFRVLERAPKGVKARMAPEWRAVMSEHDGQ